MEVVTGPRGEIEIGLLTLEATSLFLAIYKGEAKLWLSFAVFAIFLEALGIFNGTHYHETFNIPGFVPFLPLKEHLWYPLNLYPAWVSVRTLGKNRLGTASAMAIMTQFSSVPYDMLGGCGNLRFWTFIPGFEMANLDGCAGIAGIAGINFSWLCSGFALGIALYEAERRHFGFLATILVVPFCWTLVAFLWIPFHVLKASGCVALLNPNWYSISRSSTIDDLKTQHVNCIKASPVSDMVCWMSGLLLLGFAFISSCNRSFECSQESQGRKPENRMEIVATVVGYNALLLLLTFKYDREKLLLIACSSLGSIAVYLVIHVRNGTTKKTSNKEKNQ